MREGTSPRGLPSARAARSIGATAALLALSLAFAPGCSDEFESCETLRTCDSEGRGKDAGAGGLSSGAGGRGTGGEPAAGGALSGGTGGALSGGMGGAAHSGGGDAGPGAGGAPDGGDAGDATLDGAADVAVQVDGSGDADASVPCPPGQRPCGAAGCVSVTTDPDHCGACDAPCSATGTTRRACVGGECRPTCDSEHVDCNEDGRDGCEADLDTDPDHCGGCDVVCASTGVAARVCEGGVCKPTCLATHRDCNAIGKDGCEINVQNDVGNCGACSRSCSSTGVAQRRCVAAACSPTCATGLGDCSTPGVQAADDGCEASLTLSTQCGACGHGCDGAPCTAAVLTCSAQALASGVTYPISLAVTDLHVFWGREGATAGGGSLWRTPVRGGQSVELFPAATVTRPVAIVTDGTTFFWADRDARGIYAATDFAFTTYRQLVGGSGPWQGIVPTTLVRSGAYLYFSDYGQGNALRVPFDGSAPPSTVFSVVEISRGPDDFRADPPYLYYVHLGELLRVPLDGLDDYEFIAGYPPYAITATHIYAFLVNGGGEFTLIRMPKMPLGPHQDLSLLPFPSDPTYMVVAEPYAYVATTDGIYRAPVSGGLAARIAPASDVRQMAIHAGVLYWVDRGSGAGTGGLYRMILD